MLIGRLYHGSDVIVRQMVTISSRSYLAPSNPTKLFQFIKIRALQWRWSDGRISQDYVVPAARKHSIQNDDNENSSWKWFFVNPLLSKLEHMLATWANKISMINSVRILHDRKVNINLFLSLSFSSFVVIRRCWGPQTKLASTKLNKFNNELAWCVFFLNTFLLKWQNEIS